MKTLSYTPAHFRSYNCGDYIVDETEAFVMINQIVKCCASDRNCVINEIHLIGGEVILTFDCIEEIIKQIEA